MTATDSYTEAERQQHAADGGTGLATAVAHQLIARECHDLPENLIVAPADQQFYAAAGTIADRQAAVDAWAARHGVTAQWDEAAGMYSAKVRIGTSSMRASAVPVREPVSPVPADAPERRVPVAA
jgi:hypothetical protein